MVSHLVLAVVLVSFFGKSAANFQEETEVDAEKRTAVQQPKFDCGSAKYDTTTLQEFIYKHHCYPPAWKEFFALDAVIKQIGLISAQLKLEIDNKNEIEPALPHIFRALDLVKPNDITVVILGQDPTPQKGMATGLAFSLMPGQDPANVPSVFNIMIELKLEGVNVGFDNGNLAPWVAQGVLLLNSALTVRVGAAGSHQGLWKEFTRQLFQVTSSSIQPSVWLLWGSVAKSFSNKIANNKGHYVLQGGHPSSVQAAYIKFLGGNYFVCANQFLLKFRGGVIDWSLPSARPIMKPCPLLKK